MELFGKPTINPLLFYSGKISGYITWIVMFSSIFSIKILDRNSYFFSDCILSAIFFAGLIIASLSLLNLGSSTRFGLPVKSTQLKVNGLYRFSRNPMYLGFNLMTISSMIFTLNWIIIILGTYSILTYHLIIKGEERFMIDRFGGEYKNYLNKVNRYF